MAFRWNDWNTEHIAGHGVGQDEAEQVVSGASSPWPLYRGEGKWLVWGRGRGGRLLQVVFVLEEDDATFVIHARPLTDSETRRFRRMNR